VLTAFVEKRPLGATVVLDAGETTYGSYFVKRLPFVVIVDTEGNISAFSHPARVSREMLQAAATPGGSAPGDRPVSRVGRPSAGIEPDELRSPRVLDSSMRPFHTIGPWNAYKPGMQSPCAVGLAGSLRPGTGAAAGDRLT